MATFTNQATLTYRNTVVNSNVVTGEILGSIAVTKNSILPTYGYNDTVTYVVSITNSGTAEVAGLTVTDDLGTYAFGAGTLTPLTYVEGSVNYYVNGTLQPAPAVAIGSSLVISDVSVPAAGNALIIYQATANEFAPLAAGGTIVNTATVAGMGSQSASDSATVEVTQDPDLAITKGLNPAVISENGQLTYTFTVLNYGNTAAVATDNVVIADNFEPILNISAVTYNGTAWTEGVQYTYDEATGAFATVAGQITVPAATYTQDAVTGAFAVTPGEAIVTVTGTV
ncbi:MAG: hypothetical protein IJC64_03850 [Clostridia bacterium]|nr:hypothetical protein [Clostridia bacterium]